jgi:hypothetical protein
MVNPVKKKKLSAPPVTVRISNTFLLLLQLNRGASVIDIFAGPGRSAGNVLDRSAPCPKGMKLYCDGATMR